MASELEPIIAGRYRWELTHLAVIVGSLVILSVASHLIGSPIVRNRIPATAPAPDVSGVLRDTNPTNTGGAVASETVPRKILTPVEPANPREITVGSPGISSRYTLLAVDRRQVSPDLNELTIRLHIASLAAENLVSPIESDMFELKVPGQDPVRPKTPFRLSLPPGDSKDQEVVFSVPPTSSLSHAVLQVHYYNYQKEIRLDSLPTKR